SHSYIPVEVRRIIIYQQEFLHNSAAEISMNLNIPLRTVQRILERWNKMGEVINEPHREGPPKALTDEQVEFVINMLEHSPDLYLEEMKDELWYRHRAAVTLSALDNTLKELGITYKKV
ncbi:hypothetical protein EXIGLDRAFT_563188, partial [Exidia glandulosa HHB12029]